MPKDRTDSTLRNLTIEPRSRRAEWHLDVGVDSIHQLSRHLREHLCDMGVREYEMMVESKEVLLLVCDPMKERDDGLMAPSISFFSSSSTTTRRADALLKGTPLQNFSLYCCILQDRPYDHLNIATPAP
jgi:hypothetical protein